MELPADSEQIVSKQDADRIFSLTRAEWDEYAKVMVHPPGWEVRLSPLDTGTAVMAYDQNTGFGLLVQPLYADDKRPPQMLVVGNYYPAGTLPFTESLMREFEDTARTDLGPEYTASVSLKRITPFETALDVVEITIRKVPKSSPKPSSNVRQGEAKTIEALGKILLFGGWLLAMICQVYIAALAFRRSVVQGLFCLIIPAYILYFAMREETRKPKVLFLWGLGLLAFIIGVAVLSSI